MFIFYVGISISKCTYHKQQKSSYNTNQWTCEVVHPHLLVGVSYADVVQPPWRSQVGGQNGRNGHANIGSRLYWYHLIVDANCSRMLPETRDQFVSIAFLARAHYFVHSFRTFLNYFMPFVKLLDEVHVYMSSSSLKLKSFTLDDRVSSNNLS